MLLGGRIAYGIKKLAHVYARGNWTHGVGRIVAVARTEG
jgi:hypothetical protein